MMAFAIFSGVSGMGGGMRSSGGRPLFRLLGLADFSIID